MALQCLGEVDIDALLEEMAQWSKGNMLEQREAAADLCEPKLLGDEDQIVRRHQILDDITASLQSVENRKSVAFKALRKGLGTCWSVAVAALPGTGKDMMEGWSAIDDRDVRWIMKENLKTKRLEYMDAMWVTTWRARLDV